MNRKTIGDGRTIKNRKTIRGEKTITNKRTIRLLIEKRL
jgi:hypothetical protein